MSGASLLKDITGKTFGRWAVIRRDGTAWKVSTYLCRCACGGEHIVTRSRLILGRSKECRACGRKTAAKTRMLPKGTAAKNTVLARYKCGALRRNLPWELDDKTFFRLTQMRCYYCGLPPATVSTREGFNGDFTYNGVDRKDSSLGYFLYNCVPCCRVCNRVKMDLPQSDFLSLVKRIAVHRLLLVPVEEVHA